VAVVPSGGMHLWVRLDDRVDDMAFAGRAAENKVLVSAGRHWFPAEPTGSYLRLSFASASEPTIRTGRASNVPGRRFSRMRWPSSVTS